MTTKKTTEQVSVTPPEKRNPTGKGGFADHPENRNPGGWSKETSTSYWMNYFQRLDNKSFMAYQSKHPNMTMAEMAAYTHVGRMVKDLPELKEVLNRTEGMPVQKNELSTSDQGFHVSIETIAATTGGEVETNEEAEPGLAVSE